MNYSLPATFGERGLVAQSIRGRETKPTIRTPSLAEALDWARSASITYYATPTLRQEDTEWYDIEMYSRVSASGDYETS
jgi:hypothetical protein